MKRTGNYVRSDCPRLILEALATSSMTANEIQAALKDVYKVRAIHTHLHTLKDDGLVERYAANGSMKDIKYRLKKVV